MQWNPPSSQRGACMQQKELQMEALYRVQHMVSYSGPQQGSQEGWVILIGQWIEVQS